jgi:8-oxo-dGTP pyrophosphatase MutT (NUDIX family)
MPSSSALPGTLPAVTLVESLQARLVARLEGLHPSLPMKRVEWLRRIAKVLDQKARDVDGAISAYRRITELDGTNALALRELAEETGVRAAELVGETSDWIAYDLPADLSARIWGGRFAGQRQKWFAARFTGIDADIDLDAHEAEFDAWRWVALDELAGLIVPFKRPLYEAVVAELAPVVRANVAR